MGCGSNKSPDGFTRLDSRTSNNTLARKLIPVADQIRDLYTSFGLRPYMVHIIRTRWSEAIRGRGVEEITFDRILEPTPLVTDLSAITEILQPVGLDEIGGIQVAQISGRFTEDILRGFDAEGNPPEPNEQVFYEIEFPPPDGGAHGIRRRFVMRAAPMYYAARLEWVIRLERSHEDRSRQGDLR